jgi:carboxypeptidase family protein
MKRQLFRVLVLIVALSALLAAQTMVTGEIAGTVTDPSGAAVTSGKIALKNDATGEIQTATPTATGEFHFSLLRPGSYTLNVTAAGFEETLQRVTVNLAQIAAVKVQLGIQKQNQVVTVNEQAVLTQTDNANLATTIGSIQLDNLPAPGNDMTAYAFTAPGVTVSTGGGYGNFSVFGLPGVSNLFTVNGNDNMDPYLNLNNSGASNLTLGANEVQEAAVVMNGYTGQYGRQAGAQVNYITKSGANDFHGNAAFYYNEKVLNANDFFNNSTGTDRPFSISREWAGSVGGRIIKNKLFFYYDNEGLRYVLPGGGDVFIPTTDFSTFVLNNLKANNAAAVPFYTTALNLYGGASGAGRATPVTSALDPALGCGDFAGTAGWGVTKPCASSFRSTVNNLNIERLQAIRFDYNISDKDRLYVRYNDDHGVQATGTDPINPAFNANSIQPSYGGQIGYTRVISSTMVNQLLLSASYYTAIFGPPNIAASLSTFPTTWTFGDGLFSNLGGSDTSYPQGRKVRQHQLIDDYAITHGTHVIKFGVNVRQNNVSSYAAYPNTSGLFTFNSMTDFVNGSLTNGSTYSQNFTQIGAEDLKMYSLGFYAQDEWKVRPNLTVTLALRMDRNSNINCPGDCFNELGSPFAAVSHAATTPYNSTIHTGLNEAFPSVQKVVPEPRIGIAYSVTPTTVIRGGFGIFTDLYQGLIADRFLTNSPAVASFTTSSGLVAQNNAGSAFASVANSAAAFQQGFTGGATLAQLQASVPLGFATPNFNTIANQLLNPKYYEWNLEVQQAIAKNYVLSLNYVGNHGVDEINQTLTANAYSPKGFAGLPATVPDSRFGEIRELNNAGFSYYDGLVTSFKARISTNLSGTFNYTWGHSLDTLSNGGLEPFNALTAVSLRYQLNPLDLKSLNYGNSDYDTPRTISANLVYITPSHYHSKLLNGVLGGWTAATTILSHSGYPFSIVNSGIRSAQGMGNAAGLATVVVLADFLGGSSYPSCTTPNASCYSASMFATKANQLNWGNIPRNSFRGPGYFDTDLNIKKAFTYHERYKLETGAFLFNVFNHPNFDLPGNNLATGTFGQILNTVSAPTSAYGSFQGSAVSGRVVQLVVKFIF